MDNSQAENFALKEVEKRLRTRPVINIHDPVCECRKHNCDKRVKAIIPTEYCIQPMKDYDIASAEVFRKILRQQIKYSLSSKTSTQLTWCFVTINPYPHIKLENFIKKFNQFIKTKIFADYLGVIEQRATLTEALGKGFHAHILFKRYTPLNEGLPPTNIKRNIRQSWKNYCELKNPHILNIQFVGDDFAYDKYDYIRGVKLAEGKADKQLGDTKWRKENNIPEFYGNNNIIQ